MGNSNVIFDLKKNKQNNRKYFLIKQTFGSFKMKFGLSFLQTQLYFSTDSFESYPITY